MKRESLTLQTAVDNWMASTFELNPQEQRRLCENSIERVINLAIECLEHSDHPESITAEDDLRELKPLMVRAWYSAQQAVIAAEWGVEQPKFLDSGELI